jgi:hypothetical protein
VATAQSLSESPAVQRQYLAQLALTSALVQAIRNLWPVANPTNNDAGFRDAMAAVVTQFSQAGATVAQDFYRDVRTENDVPGVPVLRLVAMPPRSKVDAGIDWATRAADEAQRTEAQILARIEAAMQKAVADVTRDQTVAAVEGDEFAIGYRRVPRANACSFCIVMAIRKSSRVGRAINAGDNSRRNTYDPDAEHYGVYKSRASAGQMPGDINRFHNNCHCVVEPVFFPVSTLPGWLQDAQKLYDSSTAGSKSGERLNDFRRALSAERQGITPPTPTAPLVVAPAANGEQIKNLLNLFAA